jgi:hypothetical protein
MPMPATTIASHVRPGIRSPITALATRAVRNGPNAIVTSTLATLVSVSATMKAVNITLQQTPEIHSARPPWRTLENTARPCHSGRITSSDAKVKKLRQKVTSKLRACSRCRVTTPAVAHISVTPTISQTALPWVKPRPLMTCGSYSREARLRSCSFR